MGRGKSERSVLSSLGNGDEFLGVRRAVVS